MKMNVEQHLAFHCGFDSMENYFKEIQLNPKKYHSDEVIALLDQFSGVFLEHLNDEIETLAPENMRKIFTNPQEAKDINDKLTKWVVSTAKPMTDVPFVCETFYFN
jgi:hypothetical protein